MRLFFETASQSTTFLMFAALGFVLSLCLDTGESAWLVRFVLDLVVLAVAAVLLIFLTIRTREESIRLYHWLGLFAGSILYLGGWYRLLRWIKEQIRSCRRKIQSAGRNILFQRRTYTKTFGKG